MTKILTDLYYGEISGSERRPEYTETDKMRNKKIDDEKHYFTDQMSPDDCRRFDALERLYLQSDQSLQADAFSFGFKLGVKLMCAVFIDECEPAHSTE